MAGYSEVALRMIDSRLLLKDTLSSVIIGVVPRRSDKEVCCVVLRSFFFYSDQVRLVFVLVRTELNNNCACRRRAPGKTGNDNTKPWNWRNFQKFRQREHFDLQ